MLLPLVALQRLLHREIQAVILLLTRSPQLTLGLFSVLFFPGVLLHELSHFLMAKILRVRTGDISLVPQPLSDGRLQMGYVETERTDILRDSLIGLAPLIAGLLFVAFSGMNRFQLQNLLNYLGAGQSNLFWQGVTLLPSSQDFYLWFYLTFTVSSTMMPSESDRAAWLPLGALFALVLVMAILSGAGQWMLINLAPLFDGFLNSVALLLGFSNILHIILLIPFYFFHQLLVYIMQVDVS